MGNGTHCRTAGLRLAGAFLAIVLVKTFNNSSTSGLSRPSRREDSLSHSWTWSATIMSAAFLSAACTAAICTTMSTQARPSAVMFRIPRTCPSILDSRLLLIRLIQQNYQMLRSAVVTRLGNVRRARCPAAWRVCVSPSMPCRPWKRHRSVAGRWRYCRSERQRPLYAARPVHYIWWHVKQPDKQEPPIDIL